MLLPTPAALVAAAAFLSSLASASDAPPAAERGMVRRALTAAQKAAVAEVKAASAKAASKSRSKSASLSKSKSRAKATSLSKSKSRSASEAKSKALVAAESKSSCPNCSGHGGTRFDAADPHAVPADRDDYHQEDNDD